MLAAGNGKDHFCIPLYRFGQGEIGSRITRVERHHHIRLLQPFISRNIPLQKLQVVITVFLRQTAASADHILLQIQTDDLHLIPLKFPEKIIHGKSKIRLPAAEIHDRDLPVLWKFRENVLDEFKETVDLPIFVIGCFPNAAFSGHHAQIHKEGHRLSLRKDILLHPVMRKDLRILLHLMRFYFDGMFPLFAHKDAAVGLPSLHLEL